MAKEIPVYDGDMWDRAAILNSRQVDDEVRELAPVVWLSRENIAILGRYDQVTAGLTDWQSFSNRSRPWHDPNSVRPEILLTDDPPRHTEIRKVMAKVMSPSKLRALTADFERTANEQVDRLMTRAGETIDANVDITRPFVHKVLPDLLGMPEKGRENMSAFGHMVWATMGPMNEVFHAALEGAETVGQWAEWSCTRENMSKDGMGEATYALADAGEITHDEAKLLVMTILAAGSDTTVITMATAIRAFCEFPDQWDKLRADPSLLRNAFDESLRWDSPSRMAGRITAKDVPIGDYVLPAGTRTGLLFAAANRDPRKWQNPDHFDITRDLKGHVGWGFGLHSCVGKIMAQLEMEALFNALIKRVARFEAAGAPEWWMTTIGHGPYSLPIRFTAA
ncbi:MAG TPA: cytochrome P450 [Stellaceae bacterium]|nr:cytochrome P450 [Stellaceae bacterium]